MKTPILSKLYYKWKHGEMVRFGKCQGNCAGKCLPTILHYTPSMTMYPWDGKGKDPNAPAFYCRYCSEDYTEMMKERWAEYYGGLMC